MTRTAQVALWISFGVVAALTWVAYFMFSAHSSYLFVLTLLAVINLAQTIWILIDSRFAWRTAILAVFAFVVAQWWLFLWSGVFVIWGHRGFAP